VRCFRCNAEIPDGSTVCPNCGAPLGPVAPPPTYVPYSQMQVPRSKMAPWLWIVLGIGGVFCICPVFAAILFPVFAQARQAALSKVEMSHVRMVALGVAMYADDDRDDRLPSLSNPGKLAIALAPYLKDKRVEGYVKDYEWNQALSGKELTKLPASTWLLRTRAPDSADKIIVGFADQSVKRETVEAFNSAESKQ